MRKTTFILFSVMIAGLLFSFSPAEKEKINWISFTDLQGLYAKNPKPILVDIYTDWCGWCKEMDRTTYKHEKLAAYINKNYYAVKFNAESRASVNFNNRIFKYNTGYRVNELAVYLMGGTQQLSFPTTVFLSGTDAQPAALPGYLRPKQMEGPMKFFGEKANEKETYVTFNKKLHTEW